LAARQDGVVSREQLTALEFTDKQIRRLVSVGWLHRLHHNVFAVGHPRVSQGAHLRAALLSLGPRSFLSHRTAAAVHGLRSINIHEIEVTLVGSAARLRDGVRVHRTQTEPHRDDVRTRGDLRVSSVPRLLIELAGREPAAELERLVTEAVHKRLLRPDSRDGLASLEAALTRHARHPGMVTLTAVLATYLRTESSKSRLERAFDRILAEHPEIPDPLRNIDIDHWEIDRFWPEHNLAVELDGRPYHIAAGEMERDRIKDAALLRRGITPLRFTDFRVEHDVRGMLADLHHFLAIG
jgi:very-short-patch-repair endonuclease